MPKSDEDRESIEDDYIVCMCVYVGIDVYIKYIRERMRTRMETNRGECLNRRRGAAYTQHGFV